ncbi:MAG: CBS domain-containing protein [Halohasta sp.]
MVNDTTVNKLMTTSLETISPDTKIDHAAATLLTQEAGSLVVLNDEAHISGILTCTDLAEVVANNSSATSTTVDEYMTTEVVTISPEESIQDAAVKMITQKIQHLPVTDSEDEMIGMLSTTDITNHLTYMGSSETD